MSALRLLALSYLACASAFTVAALWRAHPDGSPRFILTIQPLAPGEERLLPRKPMAPVAPRAVAAVDDRLSQPEYAASATIAILPDLSPESAPVPPEPTMVQPRMVTPRMPRAVMPRFDIAKGDAPFRIPEPPPEFAPNRAMAAAQRFRAGLTPEMLRHFELFLYVSKAASGPLAQRMYVFRKTADNDLVLLYDWAASTGREKEEVNARGRRSFTATPAGYYELDPQRMYRRYHSWSWDQPMPNAMFFNWEREGLQTGLAIHAATGADIARLGSRASAGCVHLAPENAATLYRLIRDGYRGPTPRFAYNEATGTMTNKGGFLRDRDGRLQMADGYKVLIDIEDYGGGDIVASLF